MLEMKEGCCSDSPRLPSVAICIGSTPGNKEKGARAEAGAAEPSQLRVPGRTARGAGRAVAAVRPRVPGCPGLARPGQPLNLVPPHRCRPGAGLSPRPRGRSAPQPGPLPSGRPFPQWDGGRPGGRARPEARRGAGAGSAEPRRGSPGAGGVRPGPGRPCVLLPRPHHPLDRAKPQGE